MVLSFFFSSRRRHTRFDCDWSSDVCSSDLVKQVKADDLKDQLAMQGRSWLPFARKPYLNPFDLEIDSQRVENYYHQHGYFDVRVVERKSTPYKPGAVDVTLRVEEGPATRVNRIQVDGVQGIDAKALKDVQKLHIHKGEIFNYQHYLDEKDRISGALKQRGYAWAEVEGEVDVDRDALTADVKLR